jgi:hypothetical protein
MDDSSFVVLEDAVGQRAVDTERATRTSLYDAGIHFEPG